MFPNELRLRRWDPGLGLYPAPHPGCSTTSYREAEQEGDAALGWRAGGQLEHVGLGSWVLGLGSRVVGRP